MLINFVDKTVIGLAGVPIMQELGLSPSQFGLVGWLRPVRSAERVVEHMAVVWKLL
jgi:hypothetical protein